MAGQQIIVVVAGNMRHGKDTLADLLAELLPDARRDAYAAPLKMCVHLKTGIPMDILNGSTEQKEDELLGRYGKTPRKLMQEEGEEARERIGKTIWMDRLVERALDASERITVVSDGRHPKEEVEGVGERLGTSDVTLGVLIRRPSIAVVPGHPSEDKIAAEPNETFDAVVLNDGTLDELRAAAQQVADLVVLRAKTGLKQPEGFVVRREDGGRLSEPMALPGEAQALVDSQNRVLSCPIWSVEPVSYDLILIP